MITHGRLGEALSISARVGQRRSGQDSMRALVRRTQAPALDLEAAAGVGRLDIVKMYFDPRGRLKPSATEQQLQDGFAWACEFGRTKVVQFFLGHGVKPETRLKHNGQTGLHWAALGGHVDTVKVLLSKGASVEIKDNSFGGTPLQWALHGWGGVAESSAQNEAYYETVSSLVKKGARLEPDWFDVDDEERQRTVEKLKSDVRMTAALQPTSRRSS